MEPNIDAVASLLADGNVVVLSGAGLSTDSGIPDYRGETGAKRTYAPMTYQTFVNDSVARHRYWARGHLGWPYMRDAQPNTGHRVVADLEHSGVVTATITQNVDGLHTKAGSQHVIDLHGRLDRVICLDCQQTTSRERVHERLAAANREWRGVATAINPDGDSELAPDLLDEFVMVDCEVCGGVLKPDVVYFGENVPAERVGASYDLVEQARVLLVLGSSLHVFSGRRFVMRAVQNSTPVVIINSGPTKADDLATIKLDAPLAATLTKVQSLFASTQVR